MFVVADYKARVLKNKIEVQWVLGCTMTKLVYCLSQKMKASMMTQYIYISTLPVYEIKYPKLTDCYVRVKIGSEFVLEKSTDGEIWEPVVTLLYRDSTDAINCTVLKNRLGTLDVYSVYRYRVVEPGDYDGVESMSLKVSMADGTTADVEYNEKYETNAPAGLFVA